MNDGESRIEYWAIVHRINQYIEDSGRSREDVLEEIGEDVSRRSMI